MDVPESTSRIWNDIVTGKLSFNFELLALKILLSRLKLTVQLNPNPDSVQKCAGELRELFVKCSHLPNAQRDLKKIIEKGVA